MEISTEVNKIFGEEIAKLFAAQISEEELKKGAEESYRRLRSEKKANQYFSGRYLSEMDKLTDNAVCQRLKEAINEYLDKEETKQDIQAQAKKIVDDIRAEAEKKMITQISDQIARMHTGYSGYGLKSMVEQIVSDALRR